MVRSDVVGHLVLLVHSVFGNTSKVVLLWIGCCGDMLLA